MLEQAGPKKTVIFQDKWGRISTVQVECCQAAAEIAARERSGSVVVELTGTEGMSTFGAGFQFDDDPFQMKR